MISHMGFTLDEAMSEFRKKRSPGIYRQYLINNLYKMDGNEHGAPKVETPAWASSNKTAGNNKGRKRNGSIPGNVTRMAEELNCNWYTGNTPLPEVVVAPTFINPGGCEVRPTQDFNYNYGPPVYNPTNFYAPYPRYRPYNRFPGNNCRWNRFSPYWAQDDPCDNFNVSQLPPSQFAAGGRGNGRRRRNRSGGNLKSLPNNSGTDAKN